MSGLYPVDWQPLIREGPNEEIGRLLGEALVLRWAEEAHEK